MKRVLLMLTIAAMLFAPVSASAAIIRGAVIIGAPVVSYWGPYWWAPVPYYVYPATGTIKLDAKVKDGDIFINGAYVGNTQHDKSLHLPPGTYDLQIREHNETIYSQRVYVAAGQTVHLRVEA
ncbi:MAG TPA: PEGA domain-containing protein [Bryobacteraceae bacterium]|jgi:hypothetical protein|nr:PEGA domain-containing protein [Bryobacteraceae bacterium]